VLPCIHPAIVLTDDLQHHERLKLFLLNAGHSFLAECWRRDGLAADLTVAQAMNDAALRTALEALWAEEIGPVFAAPIVALAGQHGLLLPQPRLRAALAEGKA
jgi:tagaturonate reductase